VAPFAARSGRHGGTPLHFVKLGHYSGKDSGDCCLPPYGADRHSVFPRDQSRNQCGSAAAQCGKALPSTHCLLLGGYASSCGELQVIEIGVERQSLSALCGGRAALVLDWSLGNTECLSARKEAKNNPHCLCLSSVLTDEIVGRPSWAPDRRQRAHGGTPLQN